MRVFDGPGHHVGPNDCVEGKMVFEIFDHTKSFVLIVREDKEFDEGPRRRESAIEVLAKDWSDAKFYSFEITCALSDPRSELPFRP